MTQFKTGWSKPKPEHIRRCKAAGVSVDAFLKDIVPAKSMDLTYLTKVIDQEDLGSCTAQSIAQVVRGAQIKEGADPEKTEFMSRLMTYLFERIEDGTRNEDVGSQICTGIDAISRIGFCPESLWPYVTSKFADMPPFEALSHAFTQRGKVDVNYHQITSTGRSRIDDIERAITAGYLVTFGTLVSNDYCASAGVGEEPIDAPTSGVAGGHAQTICAFDTSPKGRKRKKINNSWSRNWGLLGYAYYSDEYLMDSMTDDFWIVKLAPRYVP